MTDASPRSAVVGRGGSVVDEGPHQRSGGGYAVLPLYYARPVRTGGGGRRTPAVAEAGAKREVDANSDEVK